MLKETLYSESQGQIVPYVKLIIAMLCVAGARSAPSVGAADDTSAKRWTGETTAALLVSLKARVSTDGSVDGAGSFCAKRPAVRGCAVPPRDSDTPTHVHGTAPSATVEGSVTARTEPTAATGGGVEHAPTSTAHPGDKDAVTGTPSSAPAAVRSETPRGKSSENDACATVTATSALLSIGNAEGSGSDDVVSAIYQIIKSKVNECTFLGHLFSVVVPNPACPPVTVLFGWTGSCEGNSIYSQFESTDSRVGRGVPCAANTGSVSVTPCATVGAK